MVIFWMWTESRGRLPMYLLMGGLSLNVVHACRFFFFEKKMSTRHAYQWSNGFEVLDMLPRDPMNWNLDVLPRGPMDLKFGHAS